MANRLLYLRFWQLVRDLRRHYCICKIPKERSRRLFRTQQQHPRLFKDWLAEWQRRQMVLGRDRNPSLQPNHCNLRCGTKRTQKQALAAEYNHRCHDRPGATKVKPPRRQDNCWFRQGHWRVRRKQKCEWPRFDRALCHFKMWGRSEW